MTLVTGREQIEAAIGAQAFSRPTFYSNPGGLRIELSESGSAVEQFLTALRKASEVCRDIFEPEQAIMVCLSVYLYRPRHGYRDTLRSLARAGIKVPRERSMWLITEEDADNDDDASKVFYIAFNIAPALLDCILWCALRSDLGIEPCPSLRAVYLLSLDQRVLVHPYDDRGMDVIGTNHDLLAGLYARHRSLLLDYDRETMAATFET